jgi:hypothetical protein
MIKTAKTPLAGGQGIHSFSFMKIIKIDTTAKISCGLVVVVRGLIYLYSVIYQTEY